MYTRRVVKLGDYDGKGVIDLNLDCTMFSHVWPTFDEEIEIINIANGINEARGINASAKK